MVMSRSENMARIRGANTSTEILFRRALWSTGLRYRLHARTPVGRPDLVFAGPKVAVFIDGCFWHGCPLHYVCPRSNKAFWAEKLRSNIARDRDQTLALESLDWRVVRIWEHEVLQDLDAAVDRVRGVVSGTHDLKGAPDWRVVSVACVNADRDIEKRHLERLRAPEIRRTEVGPRITKNASGMYGRRGKRKPRSAAERAPESNSRQTSDAI